MNGFRRCMLLAALGAPLGLFAQSAGAPAPAPASNAAAPAASSSAPAAPSAGSGDSASPSLAAMFAATRPKYVPPKPAPKVDESVDLRTIDKPKNDIIRLPNFVVHAEKPPVFRERDIYTPEGLEALAMSRYAGLNFGGGLLNGPVADEMYREDERLQNMAALQDEARTMARGGDSSESEYITRASNDTYANGFGWNEFDPMSSNTHGVPGSP